jgi:hypothetical protein
MIKARAFTSPARRTGRPGQLRIWHLSLVVLYTAVAIVDMQDHRLSEPTLIALASAGFAGYGVLAWLGWRLALRFEARLGMMPLLILYLVAMAALFLIATIVYLGIEHAYRIGLF